MRALKSLVIGLGIMIVVAMVALAYGLYYKATNPDFKLFSWGAQQAAPPAPATPLQAPTTAPAPATPAKPFGAITAPLGEGCTIVEMVPQGDKLYLRLGPGALCQQVIVIDTRSGTVLGTVTAKP